MSVRFDVIALDPSTTIGLPKKTNSPLSSRALVEAYLSGFLTEKTRLLNRRTHW
jgi:hypothetical protein